MAIDVSAWYCTKCLKGDIFYFWTILKIFSVLCMQHVEVYDVNDYGNPQPTKQKIREVSLKLYSVELFSQTTQF